MGIAQWQSTCQVCAKPGGGEEESRKARKRERGGTEGEREGGREGEREGGREDLLRHGRHLNASY